MKIAIVGKDSHVVQYYKKILKKSGFIYSNKPDIVISLGGDGTLLLAERWYPGVPKLPIRDKSICYNRDWDSFHSIIKKIKARKYHKEKKIKLQAVAKNRKMLCINEFTLRNASQIHAIRFIVSVNGKQIDDVLIGDGVIVSTPFGSTGYHHSITKKKFKNGIGIAFNNLTKNMHNMVLNENARIRIKIARGIALLSYDNDPSMVRLYEGDVVQIKKSREIAQIIKIIKQA